MRCDSCYEEFKGKNFSEMMNNYKKNLLKINIDNELMQRKMIEFRKQFRTRKNYPFGRKPKLNKKGKPTHQRISISILIHKPKYCIKNGGIIK